MYIRHGDIQRLSNNDPHTVLLHGCKYWDICGRLLDSYYCKAVNIGIYVGDC